MRTYGPGNPLVFSHIPKTAGTSLTAALVDALKPQVFVQGMDTSLAGGFDDFEDFSQVARDMMYLTPDELPADATLVAGHIGPYTTMTRYPGADHITFLRNPRSRILSQWMHSRAVTEFDIRHFGSGAESFRVGWKPLVQYLHQPLVATNTDNTIARFLAWPHPLMPADGYIDPAHDEEITAAALARLDAMAHVDLVENPALVSGVAAWLGTDLSDTRLNERSFIPKRMRPDFGRELAAADGLLAQRTRIDEVLWRHVAQKVLPDADLDAVLAQSLQQAVGRYVESFKNTPPTGRPVRRVAAFGYNTLKRFSSR
ncbi:MAG: sulfotransferase family 2 domain-containing protein [Marmoricola sp.]